MDDSFSQFQIVLDMKVEMLAAGGNPKDGDHWRK